MSTTAFEQTVDITGYKATGLTALGVWYTRNFDGDTDDYAVLTLTALDESDAEIGSATSSGNQVGGNGFWRRAELTKVLPADTAKVKVTITTEGENPSKANIAGVSLHVGQLSDQLLDNPSFDSGDTTDWTDVSNSFGVDVGLAGYAGGSAATAADCAQGGQFASSEISQTQAIPSGYPYGDAVLTFARRTETAGDTGEVVLEVLDGSSSVIASSTTGAESPAVGDGWVRRKLIVTLPDGAASLRVRLIADRAAGSGYSGAGFDDFALRIHKDLDPAFERELDFATPTRQVMPRTWQEAYLGWNLGTPLVWNGDDVLPSVPQSLYNAAASAAWSDASTPTAAKFVGHWTHDESVLSVDAYRFARALAGDAVDLQIDGYGDYAKADTFSIAVCFRVTERAMSLACGLVGHRDADGKGWGLSLDTSGRVVATVQGTAARTATGTVDHRDGAAHWVLMTWNGSTLRVVDATSTATNGTDPGEFDVDVPMRIGRDGPASATGGVDIARVLVWDGVAITQAQFQDTIDVIGDDPNGLVSWTSSQPVWVDAADDSDGATLVRAAARHVPVGYSEGYAVSVGAAVENLILSTDYPAGEHCGPEANVTLTHGIEDPTGLPRGVRIANSVNAYGYRLSDLPIGTAAGVLWAVVWLRTADNTEQNVTLRLLDSDESTSDADTQSVTSLWQRFEVGLEWSGDTPTAHLKISVEDNSPCQIELGGVVFAALDTRVTAYPDAAVSVGDRHGVVSETLPVQLNHEGEIEVRALARNDDLGMFASVDNNSGLENRRSLFMAATTKFPYFHLRDDSGSAVATLSSLDGTWSGFRTIRGRWTTLELPESLGDTSAFAEDETVEASDSTAFSADSTANTKIRIGGGDPFGSVSPHAWLRNVTVRAREEKLW